MVSRKARRTFCTRHRFSKRQVDLFPSCEGSDHHLRPTSKRPVTFFVYQKSAAIRTVMATKLMMKLVENQVQNR